MRDLVSEFLTLRPEITGPEQALEELVRFLCPHGVVVGGTYQHFKGTKYKVLGFVRPSSDWENLHVRYVQVDDVEHEATRPLSEFLDQVERPDYSGPRFRLVKV